MSERLLRPGPAGQARQDTGPHPYTTVQDLYTLTYRIDPDGVARWTGEVVPLPSLVTKAPGPAVADLVRILSDPSLDGDTRND